MMRMKGQSIVFSLLVLLLLTGCSATKYLNEDQRFYAGTKINLQPVGRVGGKKEVTRTLEGLITPDPNTKVLGMRPGVWLYYRQRDSQKTKGLKAFIRRKFGQVPVLITDIRPEQTSKLLEGTLQNEGYFGSTVDFEIKDRKKRKEAVVVYNVELYRPYRLREIRYPQPKDSVYKPIMRSIAEGSFLKENQRYELARLQAEQERVEKEVENFGLYYFDDRYLIFEADSTVGDKQVDLRLRLEEGVPARVKTIFRIGEVNVYPDYTLDSDTTKLEAQTEIVDSMRYHDLTRKFRPKVITDVINIRKGNIYSTEDHSLSLTHLMDLGVFKFVNIQYTEIPDSNLLKANVFLTPLKKRSIRAEFQAVSKSNSFAGPGLQVTFTDRNFLSGAELFQLRLNSSYESQISKRISGPLNSFELGAEASLTVPRFLAPFRIDYSSKKYLPKTDFRVGFNLQNRVSFFRLNTFNLSAGYQWRESEEKNHELYPIDISFVQTGNQSPEFQAILEKNRFLRNSFDDQFILGSRYSYTLNTQMKQDLLSDYREKRIKTHSLYFNGTVQLAGNIAHAIQGASKSDDDQPYEIFHAAYSQFVRGDIDFRHYWQFDQRNKLASRIILGTGYAYGNSRVFDETENTMVRVMPYVRQFSIGGANSLRAFPARSVGPGSYSIRDDERYQPPNQLPAFVDQRGDIKLEANVEFRFDIIKAFKGAVFVDAGNIWLFSEDSDRPGGKFENDFLKELAVGTGLGFRFDFNFFVLRFDLAFPLRVPNADESRRWVIDDIDFGSSKWRGDNLVFNIAIGYPF